MRKIIASTYSTLDGSPDTMAYALEMTTGCDALLLGRITYEGMAQAWPTMGGNPYADHVNDTMTKYVVASQPVDTSAWNPTVVIDGDDLAAQVTDIKKQDGDDILIWGNGRLTDALAATACWTNTGSGYSPNPNGHSRRRGLRWRDAMQRREVLPLGRPRA